MRLTLFILLLCIQKLCETRQCLPPIQISQRTNSSKNAQSQVQGVQSGHRTILWPTNNSKTYQLTTPYKQTHKQSEINVLVTVVMMQNYIDTSEGVYLQFYPTIGNKSFTTVLKYSNTTTWKIIHIHYIVTSNPNLRCAHVSLDNAALAKISKRASSLVYQDISLKNTSVPDKQKNYQCQVFISGIKNTDQSFQIRLNKCQYNPSTKNITFAIVTKNMLKPLQLLSVSYSIIFNSNQRGQPYLASFQNVAYFQMLLKKPKSQIKNLDTSVLVGISSFNGIQLNKVEQENKKLPKQSRRLLEQNLQVSTEDVFKAVPDYYLDIYKKAFSITEFNVVVFTYTEPIVSQGYVNYNNQRYETIKNMISTGRCFTPALCSMLNGKMLSSIYEETSYRDQFPLNQSSELNESPQIRIQTNICLLCSQNQTFSDQCKTCKCKPGHVRFKDRCYSNQAECGQGNTFDQTSCYQLIDPQQRCKLTNHFYNQQSQSCECPDGYIEIINKLHNKYCIKDCPQNFVFNSSTKQCQCKPWMDLINGKCVNKDSDNKRFLDKRKIVCGVLYKWNTQKYQCQCKDETIRARNGDCIICPYGTLPDLYQGLCRDVPLDVFNLNKVKNTKINNKNTNQTSPGPIKNNKRMNMTQINAARN